MFDPSFVHRAGQTTMTTDDGAFRDLSRVLCAHRWQDIEEWVGAIRVLADLSDDEIVGLQRRDDPADAGAKMAAQCDN
jgi:hypothetical protein